MYGGKLSGDKTFAIRWETKVSRRTLSWLVTSQPLPVRMRGYILYDHIPHPDPELWSGECVFCVCWVEGGALALP